MKNRFFQIALQQASRFLGKKGRLLLLLTRLAGKLKFVNWKAITVPAVKEKFFILGRITRAYALGHYRDISLKSMLSIVAAIIYFVSPIDLIPDFIPVTGLTDDVGVLLWVYNSLNSEVVKFLAWEKTKISLV